jgi:hypothetical protein
MTMAPLVVLVVLVVAMMSSMRNSPTLNKN